MSIVIPRIKNTDKANADTFNTPLNAVEQALNNINSALLEVSNKSALIAYNVPASDDCFVGALVRFDPASGVFVPAVAIANLSAMHDGKYINAPEASVIGMIIRITSSGIADILIQGQYSSHECVYNCLEDKTPGIYFLSNTNKGKASTDHNGIVVQPVLLYLGGSDIFLNITHQMPSQYQGSVVRGATTSSESLTVSVSDNGVLDIGTHDPISTGIELSQTAISSINGNRYTTTPIISSVSGVGGVSVTTNNLGEAFIGLSSELGHNIQASEYNLNGTKRVSDDIYTYIVFPSGKSSSVTISRHIDVSCEMAATPWVHVISGDAITFTTMSYFVPDPDKTIGVSPTDIRGVSSDIPVGASGSNIILGESSDPVSVVSSGTLISRITINAPSVDIKLLRAGYFMTPVAGASLLPEYSKNDALIASGIAGESISKDSIIGLNKAGRIVLASCDDDSIPIAGVALNPVPVGGICKYTTYGHHKTDNTLSQNSTYYVGLNGALTSMAPDIPNYEQRVGEAIGDNILRVDIEERVY